MSAPLGEVKIATDEDFDSFRDFCDSTDDWHECFDKDGVQVWDKPSDTGLNIAKLHAKIPTCSARVLYDVLHDPDYRKTWDENMIDGHLIEQLDKHNDVGYYSAKLPMGVTNRDFVNERSWRVKEGEMIIINHSVPHKDKPEEKGFVRGNSILAGYIVRPDGEGCTLSYIAQSDPKGWIPGWLVNKVTTKFAPKLIDKMREVGPKYDEWKKDNPGEKIWYDEGELELCEGGAAKKTDGEKKKKKEKKKEKK